MGILRILIVTVVLLIPCLGNTATWSGVIMSGVEINTGGSGGVSSDYNILCEDETILAAENDDQFITEEG